jgi:hypothetical protein
MNNYTNPSAALVLRSLNGGPLGMSDPMASIAYLHEATVHRVVADDKTACGELLTPQYVRGSARLSSVTCNVCSGRSPDGGQP